MVFLRVAISVPQKITDFLDIVMYNERSVVKRNCPVKSHVGEHSVRVFGSRVRGTAKPFSDLI